MKHIIFTLTASVLLLSAGCKKEVEPQTSGSTKLDVVWKVPLVGANNGATWGITPVIYDDMVIFKSDYPVNGFPIPVLFLDADDGSIRHIWNDQPFGFGLNAIHHGDFIVFSTSSRIDCLNLASKKTQWTWNQGTYQPLYASNNHVYQSKRTGKNGTFVNAILRTPITTASWDTVYSHSTTSNNLEFSGIGFGKLTSGDEVVVWKSEDRINGTYYTSVIAFNLTADSLLWQNQVVADNNFDLAPPLLVNEGVVYGVSDNKAFAIDLLSGKTLWVNSTFFNPFFSTKLIVIGPYLFVKDSSELHYINKLDGKIANTINKLGFVRDEYVYLEGKLFGAGENLTMIDIGAGKELYQNTSWWDENWYTGITIDAQKRVFYASDGYYAYCIKIPDL